jgi:DNA-directed RNA polymerase specialized sigma54-like protein
MALSQRLEFRQTQTLVMTPQLMQAIKLLQLSSLDLAAYVEGELERNPLLERAGEDDAPATGTETDRASAERDEDAASTLDWIGADQPQFDGAGARDRARKCFSRRWRRKNPRAGAAAPFRLF